MEPAAVPPPTARDEVDRRRVFKGTVVIHDPEAASSGVDVIRLQ